VCGDVEEEDRSNKKWRREIKRSNTRSNYKR
jgi:hypothetical protein